MLHMIAARLGQVAPNLPLCVMTESRNLGLELCGGSLQSKRMLRILLTGVTGFVGEHLCRRFLQMGHQVHALVRPSSDLTQLRSICEHPAFRWSIHDDQRDEVSAVFESVKPELVIHLAALFRAEHSSADVRPLIDSNISFGTRLVDAMVSHNVRRLITVGTSWQHFQNMPYSPVCLYAATKQAFEDILQFYVEAQDLRVIVLKLFDTYGPGDRRKKLIMLLKSAAENGETIEMSGGEQLIDLVHIDDVVQAFVIATHRLASDQVLGIERYAVNSENPISLRNLVALYQRVTGSRVSVLWGSRPYRRREVMQPWSEGIRLAGWMPSINLEQGLRSLAGGSSCV